jgi:hypothetical protein
MHQNRATIAMVICLIAMAVLCLTMSLNRPKETDYVLNIVDDSLVIYHYDKSYVGTVKSEGQLDSLLIDDNL